jgi:hypothetical protein
MVMKKNRKGNERKPDPEGIAFWIDNYDRHIKDDHGNFLLDGIDAPGTYDVTGIWEELGIDWSYIGPHPFKVGDRIILFNYREETSDSIVRALVHAIEVIDVGPSELKIPGFYFSHFIAYRTLKGCAPVKLSLDHVLELRSQGLITSIPDLQRRKKLSQEEWDGFVRIFKLRQEQPEVEKHHGGKTS